MTPKNAVLFLLAILSFACVPKEQYSGTMTSTSAALTTTTASGGSCSDFSGYATLTECKAATLAQCTPSTKVVNGATAVCYIPVPGWEGCASNRATWTYGAWTKWCVEKKTIAPPFGSVYDYKRTRNVTCTKTLSACDCGTVPTDLEEKCTAANGLVSPTTAYDACKPGGDYTGVMCTATGTPTPSQTEAWCTATFLNYAGTDYGILSDLNSKKYFDIYNYFVARKYRIQFVRSPSTQVTGLGYLTPAEAASNYVIEVNASKSGCFLGKKISVGFRVLQGGKPIASSSSTSACVSFGDEASRSLDRALNDLNAPTCF